VGTCAFPCDSEVPCFVTAFFYTLWPKSGCCMQIKEITGKEVKKAPSPETMQREKVEV